MEHNEAMAHVPAYGPNAVWIGTIALGVLAALIVIGALLRRPRRGRPRWSRRRPRRR